MWVTEGIQSSGWITMCFVNIGIWTLNSKGATHWRFENGELKSVSGEEETIFLNDPIFKILANPTTYTKTDVDNSSLYSFKGGSKKLTTENYALATLSEPSSVQFQKAALTCGEPVNETSIDHLDGIAARFKHPTYPEPEVALLFRKNEFDNVQVEVIEVNLMDALELVENKMILYIQIGNFLRIKGDTYHAIECFRSAYYVSNKNMDALLNLARMMSNLNYIRDALYLAQLSLDVAIATERSGWLQHYTLGELFEKHGDMGRAFTHFQLSLDENPSFHPAYLNLKRLGINSKYTYTHVYTVILMGVMCCVILFYVYVNIIKVQEQPNNNYNYKRTGCFKR